MSSFYDYDKLGVSQSYAELRTPFCGKIFIPFIKHLIKRPFEELSFVDAGCGTGDYALEMLKEGARCVRLFDASTAQLQQAGDRLSKYQKDGCDITLTQTLLPTVPLPEASCDVVICCQVLHHLTWEDRYKTLETFHKILKPGGVVCLATSTPDQVSKTPWYYRPWPEALKKTVARHISVPKLRDLYQKAGLQLDVALALCHEPECIRTGDDPIPLIRDPLWRQADSIWNHVEDSDIERGIALLQDPENVKLWKKEGENVGTEVASIGFKA